VSFLKLQQAVAEITVFDQLNILGFIIVVFYKFSVTCQLHKTFFDIQRFIIASTYFYPTQLHASYIDYAQ